MKRFTREQVLQILEDRKRLTYRELAKKWGTSTGYMGELCRRSVYKDYDINISVYMAANRPNVPRRTLKCKLSEADIQTIFDMRATKSVREIAATFGMATSSIRRVLNRRYYKHSDAVETIDPSIPISEVNKNAVLAAIPLRCKGLSIPQIADELKISEARLRRAWSDYKSLGLTPEQEEEVRFLKATIPYVATQKTPEVKVRQIEESIASGMTYREIAAKVGVCVKTVQTVRNRMRKLEAETRDRLAAE